MKKYTTILFIGFLWICSANLLQAQDEHYLDSLKTVLARYDQNQKAKGITTVSIKDSIKANLLFKIARAGIEIEPEKAMANAREQLALSQKIDYKLGIIRGCNIIGYIYDNRFDYRHSIQFYQYMAKTSIAIKEKRYEATAYNNIGAAYGQLLNYPEGVKYLLKGLEISKSTNDQFGIASAYNNLGVMYRQSMDLPEALKSYFAALKVMQQLNNLSAVATINRNIGQIYAEQHKTKEAITFFNKGLEIAKQIGDKQSEYLNYNGLGTAYIGMEQFDKAIENFEAALELATQAGYASGVAENDIQLGRTYYLKEDFPKAIAYTKKAQLVAAATQNKSITLNVYELLSMIYAETGNYKSAYQNQVLLKALDDSLAIAEKEQSISKLKLQYDVKTAQDSLKAIQAKKDIVAHEAIKTQRNTRNFILIGMSLIVIFLVILLWQRSKIAAIKRQKALVQERNRISRDLHDNLGTQLSTVRMFVSSLKNGGSASDTVDNSLGLLDASIAELRGIMDEMGNSVLTKQGYLEATEILINKINQLHGVQFTLTHHHMEARAIPEIEHQLYRITQELINNTLKYARAGHVIIDVLRRDGKLILMYEDDGIGFNPETVRKGNGLQNIETRAQSAGGTATFDATPGNGSRTIIEIPE
jgi:signal transduction histidine kinase